MSRRLYHVADRSLQASIRLHGLDHRRGPLPSFGGEIRPGNYLFSNRARADAFALERYDLEGADCDIWQVGGEGLSLAADRRYRSGAWICTVPIAPERLTLIAAAP